MKAGSATSSQSSDRSALSPLLSVRLLGGLSVTLGGRALPPLESARGRVLARISRRAPRFALPRERVAFVLWPDSREPQARTNLRHLLHTLRRALPEVDGFLDVTPRTLRWRDDESFELDVDAFEAAVARSGDDEGGDALREAVGLYGGDLLAGSYDEWVLEERERLRQLFVDTLERLATLLDRAWARAGWDALRPRSTGIYANFISDEAEAGVEAAYGTRIARLTALKDRWDPENVFHLNANIAPSAGGNR
jgi:Berberine and berberine like/Bacterial transcriptional activator domain